MLHDSVNIGDSTAVETNCMSPLACEDIVLNLCIGNGFLEHNRAAVNVVEAIIQKTISGGVLNSDAAAYAFKCVID